MHNLCQPLLPKKLAPNGMMAWLLPVFLYKAQFAQWNKTMTMMLKRFKNNEMRVFLRKNRKGLCQFSDSGFLTESVDPSPLLFGLNEVM
jgi:hypothetical protein